MVFSNLTIKLVLIIVNCFNIVGALIHIAISIFNYKDVQEVESMITSYVNMVISGICCAAAFVESTIVLEVIATVFLCGIVTTTVIWIYIQSFCTYTLVSMILNGIIAAITYMLIHRLRKINLQNMISSFTSPVMMPLNPPNNCG
ncbi:uncharacterized protein LOC106081354 [Stomoxys calcitrans]|uniref:Uncharacterized protein n=1 Tax=Stomoxys calcitrans TaxID=35570 RepID=A0A1I8NYP0_STOCA|nr:uncharacterized protein LOC106081354 [Stomoxys calcitrans]